MMGYTRILEESGSGCKARRIDLVGLAGGLRYLSE